MNETLRIEKRDYVPKDFEQVTMPEHYGTIWTAIKGEGRQDISGFEDVLSGEKLGGGMQTNNPGGVFQLAFALSIAQSDKITEIVRESSQLTPNEVVGKLRNIQALSGMKIIDLGCGEAYFARAAAALGAAVYTADSKDLNPDIKAKLKGHIVVDLNEPRSLEVLKRGTGGDFDLVTEWIMSPTEQDDYCLSAP